MRAFDEFIMGLNVQCKKSQFNTFVLFGLDVQKHGRFGAQVPIHDVHDAFIYDLMWYFTNLII